MSNDTDMEGGMNKQDDGTITTLTKVRELAAQRKKGGMPIEQPNKEMWWGLVPDAMIAVREGYAEWCMACGMPIMLNNGLWETTGEGPFCVVCSKRQREDK